MTDNNRWLPFEPSYTFFTANKDMPDDSSLGTKIVTFIFVLVVAIIAVGVPTLIGLGVWKAIELIFFR